jgi:hypothetical protein
VQIPHAPDEDNVWSKLLKSSLKAPQIMLLSCLSLGKKG